MKKRRYERTVVMYFDADNDQDAIIQSEQFDNEQKKKFDNQTKTLFIFESPFGSLSSRQIYPKI
jgi:hypothetical protein